MPVHDVATATAIINECMKGGDKAIFKDPMPETSEAKLTAANYLVGIAQQARDAGIASDPVTNVFNLVDNQPPAGAPAAAPAPVSDNPFAAAAAAPAAPAPVQAPEPVPASAPTGNVMDTVFGGEDEYAELGTDEVIEKLAGLTQDQVTAIQAYELNDAGRPKILKFALAATPAPVPEAAPAPAAEGGIEFNTVEATAHATTEPWKGFNKAKIGEIVAVIENLVQTEGEQAKNVLAHVWNFETGDKGKGRSRLTGKLKEIAENGVVSSTSAPAPATPAAQPVEPAVVDSTATEDPDVKATPPFTQPAATLPPVADGTKLSQPLQGATQQVDAQIASEGLPVPSALKGEAPELPENFVDVGLAELGELASKFNACQARANYLGDVASGHSSDAKIHADGLVRAFRNENEFPKNTTETTIDAKASESVEVQEARRIQHDYSTLARRYKVLADIYGNTIERISRELTRRQIEAGK